MTKKAFFLYVSLVYNLFLILFHHFDVLKRKKRMKFNSKKSFSDTMEKKKNHE